MFLKCHLYLHPLVEYNTGFLHQGVYEDCNLNIFEQSSNTSEPTKELVNKELLISKDMKCMLKV
jgi:hypothetical protein